MATIFLSKKQARNLGLISKKKKTKEPPIADLFNKVLVRLLENAVVVSITSVLSIGAVAYSYIIK